MTNKKIYISAGTINGVTWNSMESRTVIFFSVASSIEEAEGKFRGQINEKYPNHILVGVETTEPPTWVAEHYASQVPE